jgi:hypothetical protein
MLDHISNQTIRSCVEALVQMNREGDVDGILSLVGALDEATGSPVGEILLAGAAQIGKAASEKPGS